MCWCLEVPRRRGTQILPCAYGEVKDAVKDAITCTVARVCSKHAARQAQQCLTALSCDKLELCVRTCVCVSKTLQTSVNACACCTMCSSLGAAATDSHPIKNVTHDLTLAALDASGSLEFVATRHLHRQLAKCRKCATKSWQ